MVKDILFDFDGVIAESRDLLLSLFREASPHVSVEDFKAHFDGNVYEAPHVTFTRDSEARLHDQYCRRLVRSHLEASIAPITRLSRTYRLFIVSSGEERGICKALDQAGLSACFRGVYGRNTHRSKIEKFRLIRDRFGVKLDQAVFVTDTLGDIREAKALDLFVIAETFGFHDQARLERGKPDVIAHSWADIEQVIEDIARLRAADQTP